MKPRHTHLPADCRAVSDVLRGRIDALPNAYNMWKRLQESYQPRTTQRALDLLFAAALDAMYDVVP